MRGPVGRRVAAGGCPPAAPTDPGMRLSRTRLFRQWFRCSAVHTVHHARRGQGIGLQQTRESVPRHAPAPASSTEPLAPSPTDFGSESSQRRAIPRHAVVGIVTAQCAAQHRMLVAHPPVPMLPAPLANPPQRSAESVLGRLALDHPSPRPGASPIMREPQHREAALALRAAPPRLRRSAKLHHPRLLRMQPKAVLPKPLRQHPKHPPRVVFVLKHQHRIVGIADLKRPPPKPRLHLVLEPLVQHLVQVDVG